MELARGYNFKEIEKKWQKYWEKEKIYKFDSKLKGLVYSIDTPPPTVSGKMHIGHAFSYSQQDFVVRYRRMNGAVYYPFGTDDNGLPTERLVEKLNNVKSKSMSRPAFIELCLKTLKEITPDFIDDWKRLGVSCDYDAYYSTIDKNSQRLSQKSFLDLYKKGLIYKKDFPSLWCPECQTAIAQAELEDKELPSLFSTLKFKCSGKDLLIATTRPELIGACVAVFVNPGDKKYKDIIGKKANVPLFDYEVPIIADESADIEKGTGILMICSYGDKYDAEAINRHKLNPKIILNVDGTLNIGGYDGLKIREARKKILADLRDANLITEQKQITHTVNVHDKCGTETEILPTEQWFIKVLDNKKRLIEQGRKIRWHPGYMLRRYENWVNGLEWDWNISRDRHFGVAIPVWECKGCDTIILADEKELPVDPLQTNKKCPKCKKNAKGEEKVLDTWATSSLTPQIASSLNKDIRIPYSLRPQAHDIIRTWAFYTIVKSFYHENKIPWNNIMISGFVTLGGEKMSKSKGNVIQPQDVIDKYGADALRFWAAGSKLGEDLDYQEKDLITGQKTMTKLWNASKFILMHLDDYKDYKGKLEVIDSWLLAKLNELIKECTEAFESYEYSKVKSEVDKFFWHVLCDNYLEIVKDRLYNPDKRGENTKRSAQFALYSTLNTILKLFAPVMPFITEEIYSCYYAKREKRKSVHVTDWPEVIKRKDISRQNEKIGDLFVEVVSKVRQEKSKMGKSLKEPVKILCCDKILKVAEMDLIAVTHAEKIEFGKEFKVQF